MDFETDQRSSPPPLVGTLIASDAISRSELSTLQELVQACTPVTIASTTAVPVPLEKLPPGATGRVAAIELAAAIDEEFLEEWQGILCQQIDEILYSELEDSIRQPILLWFSSASAKESTASRKDLLFSRIQQDVLEYGLVVENKRDKQKKPSSSTDSKFVPSLRYEVDGAMVSDDNEDSAVWDTSSVVVLDDLVSPDLRARLRQVVLGSGTDWNDAQDGPDPSRWSEGGLIDLPDQECEEDVPVSYGLTDQALEEICQDSPTPLAFQEFESLLATLLEDFKVTRLPEAVLGAGVTPLTANAPCYGQTFNDHIDADPFFAPPSPWTDVFGRYANRARGKPRFVSCLVYLNDEWRAEEWGAPTRFYDVASGTAVDVAPRPGRVVLMDQDITHTVVPPLEAAGKCPRYSLVWKLVLHPKKHQQDMRPLAKHWLEPIYVGSAQKG